MRKASTGGVPSPGMCRNAPWIWQIDVNCDMLIHFTKTFYCCRHQTALGKGAEKKIRISYGLFTDKKIYTHFFFGN